MYQKKKKKKKPHAVWSPPPPLPKARCEEAAGWSFDCNGAEGKSDSTGAGSPFSLMADLENVCQHR